MAKTLRVGMVGYGFMGRAHSNAWRQVGHFFPLKGRVEMHTICGRTRSQVETARAQLGWQLAATDWREVVESPLIDIVDISAPNGAHAEIAIAAARNGKHVLCEKPLATSVKEAEAMFSAAQKAHVTHMVCHNYRRIPAVALAKKMIAEGALGKVLHFHGRYAQDWALDAEFVARRQARKGPDDSGANADIHVHMIDLARHLVGELKEVCGMTHAFPKDAPVTPVVAKSAKPPVKAPVKEARTELEDSAWLLGRFEQGAVANLAATRCAAGRKNHIELEINGTRGSLHFDFEDMNRLRYFDGTNPPDRQGFREILVTQPAHPYVGQWWPAGHGLGYEHTFVHTAADFLNACVEGKPVTPSFEDGLKNQRVLEAVEKSGKSGRWVSL
jgi:predicted dehydrogenase